MKVIILVVAWFCLLTSVTLAEDISELNGTSWRSWDGTTKAYFINGFISATNNTVENNTSEWKQKRYKQASSSDDKCGIRMIMATDEEFRNKNLQAYSIYNISVSQIIDGLDRLYTDFKNRGINIADAIYVVKKQIKGAAPTEVDKVLLYLRSGDLTYLDTEEIEETTKLKKTIEFP